MVQGFRFIQAILGLCWGYIGKMEKKMETMGIIGFIRAILGLCWVWGLRFWVHGLGFKS